MTPIGTALSETAWEPRTVRLPRVLWQRYKAIAQAEHRSLNGQLVTALHDWMDWKDCTTLLVPPSETVVPVDEMMHRVRAVMQHLTGRAEAVHAAQRDVDTALQVHAQRLGSGTLVLGSEPEG